jgi:segregation and condensation protein B
MSLKAQVEALIYAAEEPLMLDQLAVLLKDAVLAELAAARDEKAAAAADEAQSGDLSSETPLLPELDAAWEQELSGLCPSTPIAGELGTPDPDQSIAPEDESSSEDDEPFFATEAAALSEFASEEGSAEAAAPPTPQQANLGLAGDPVTAARKRQPKKSEQEIADDKAVRARLREVLAELVADYAGEERGMEIRQVAGGFRMATKPQHHDLVRAFAKGLKPPIRLSLAALETLAVIAYKQPVTAPEIADIRGVDSAGVLGTLLDRKLITTAGRKQVIGRPMQYKTSKEFLLRFGLNDLNELPSMEEFSQLAFDSAIEESTHTASPGASESPSDSNVGPGEMPEAGNALDQ